MKAAHYARQTDLDPDLIGKDQDRAAARARETGSDESKARDQYALGKEILALFTLTYSERFVVGTVQPTVPENVVAYTTVDAGHLATSPAQRLALFRCR